jgi:hypothetical protein
MPATLPTTPAYQRLEHRLLLLAWIPMFFLPKKVPRNI